MCIGVCLITFIYCNSWRLNDPTWLKSKTSNLIALLQLISCLLMEEKQFSTLCWHWLYCYRKLMVLWSMKPFNFISFYYLYSKYSLISFSSSMDHWCHWCLITWLSTGGIIYTFMIDSIDISNCLITRNQSPSPEWPVWCAGKPTSMQKSSNMQISAGRWLLMIIMIIITYMSLFILMLYRYWAILVEMTNSET